MNSQQNVLGGVLQPCSDTQLTGFCRDGFCRSHEQDLGLHTVCAVMTEDFLNFTVSRGNDLVTPKPEWDFPGLKPGDHWCLCAARWLEAFESGCAPKVKLASTNIATLKVVPLEALTQLAIDNH